MVSQVRSKINCFPLKPLFFYSKHYKEKQKVNFERGRSGGRGEEGACISLTKKILTHEIRSYTYTNASPLEHAMLRTHLQASYESNF